MSTAPGHNVILRRLGLGLAAAEITTLGLAVHTGLGAGNLGVATLNLNFNSFKVEILGHTVTPGHGWDYVNLALSAFLLLAAVGTVLVGILYLVGSKASLRAIASYLVWSSLLYLTANSYAITKAVETWKHELMQKNLEILSTIEFKSSLHLFLVALAISIGLLVLTSYEWVEAIDEEMDTYETTPLGMAVAAGILIALSLHAVSLSMPSIEIDTPMVRWMLEKMALAVIPPKDSEVVAADLVLHGGGRVLELTAYSNGSEVIIPIDVSVLNLLASYEESARPINGTVEVVLRYPGDLMVLFRENMTLTPRLPASRGIPLRVEFDNETLRLIGDPFQGCLKVYSIVVRWPETGLTYMYKGQVFWSNGCLLEVPSYGKYVYLEIFYEWHGLKHYAVILTNGDHNLILR